MDEDLDETVRPSASARPGWVFGFYAFRAIAGLAVAAPLAIEVGVLVSRLPRGDAVLFDAGGEVLLDVVRKGHQAAPAIAAGAGIGLLVAAFVGLAPLAALLVAIGHRGALPLRVVAARSARALGTLSLLWGLALFTQAVTAALVHFGWGRVVTSFGWAPPRDNLARVAGVVVVVALALGIGVAHDLARVVAVDELRGTYLAMARAIEVVRARPGRVLASYAARASLAAGALAVGVALAARVGHATAPRFALSAIAHQASLLVAVALRASWLAAAMRHARATPPET